MGSHHACVTATVPSTNGLTQRTSKRAPRPNSTRAVDSGAGESGLKCDIRHACENNALRYLANELRISSACLGTEEMMRVIRSVPSVENRFPPMVLPQWPPDHEFRKLSASFEKIIPLKYPSGLPKNGTLTAKLLARSEGTIGELKMLLPTHNSKWLAQNSDRLVRSSIDNYSHGDRNRKLAVRCSCSVAVTVSVTLDRTQKRWLLGPYVNKIGRLGVRNRGADRRFQASQLLCPR
jgi:hypothetical protein